MPEEAATRTINLCLVRGVASGPPELRTLASGRRLATFAVKTHGLEPPATSVPVVVWGSAHLAGGRRPRVISSWSRAACAVASIAARPVGLRPESSSKRRWLVADRTLGSYVASAISHRRRSRISSD